MQKIWQFIFKIVASPAAGHTSARPVGYETSLYLQKQGPHQDYLSRLDTLARFERRLFICKSAPSTVFEALARKIPVLALNSGLPMEQWVGELVTENAIGGFYNFDNPLALNAGKKSPPIRIGKASRLHMLTNSAKNCAF